MGGQGERVAERVWKDVAASEARLSLIRTMKREKMGFADVEEIIGGLNNKLKSNKIITRLEQGGRVTDKVLEEVMKVKLRDEQSYRRELTRTRAELRREMEVEMGGKDNKNFKRFIDKLERGAKEVRVSLREKYRNKL